MIEAMEQGQDAMDALIDYLAIHHSVEETENGEVIWKSKRRTTYDNLKDIWVPAGWVVPIATGFQGISDLAEAKNQRDSSAPHCFAESVVTLGEFKMPYRFTSVDDMLWRYHYDEGQKLYQCQALTHHQPASESPDDEFA
jgi:CRISPR-associated protein Csy2